MNPAIDFFHPNVCHVCKITCKEVELKRCGQCRMISYCSTKHQKQNWTNHKELCRAVVQVFNMTHVLEEDIKKHRLRMRLAVMRLCEMFLGRKLDALEMNMVYFRKSCWYCDTEENLQDCLLCLSNSACRDHLYVNGQHEGDCEQLRLCLDAHLFKSRDYFYPNYTIRKNPQRSFKDMDTFLTKNVKTHLSTLAKTLMSDLLTRPLTLYYALQILQDDKIDDNLTIHIVGSTQFETTTAQHWEILRTLLGVKSLQLSFIGPEVRSDDTQRTTNMLIRSSSKFYHQLSAKETADVIVIFNCGLHEFEGADDTWGPSLVALLSRKTPIVLTSYTLSEAILDVDRLRELDPGLRVRQYGNPFASLSPLRDIESLGVYFVNSILSIVTSESNP